MPNYRYKARDRSGIAIAGSVEAASQAAVSASLRELGYQIIYVEERRGAFLWVEQFGRRLSRGASPAEVIFFTRQLAMMVTAGLPLLDGLQGMTEQTFSPAFKRVITMLAEDLRGGKSFSEALARHPALFGNFYVSMVRAGETAGILAQVLERLAAIGEEELELKGRIRSALAYPVLLVFLSLGIVTFLLIAVLPKFVGIFEESGTALPVPTVILLTTSRTLQRFWYLIPILIAAVVTWVRRYSRTPIGKYKLHLMVLQTPVVGVLIQKSILARFSRTMASLLKSGIPVVPALTITHDLVGNEAVAQAITHIREAVVGGASLAEPFRLSRVFPPTVVQLVAVGERTGNLDQMFLRLGDYYDGEVQQALRTLTSVLEPILLLGMGLLVGFIALSVLLPIFNLIKVFKR